MNKILFLENINRLAAEKFAAAGFEIENLPQSLDENMLAEKIKDIAMLGIRSKTKITKKILENAPHLAAIGAFCIGTDQIDLLAATERGIAVFNAPYSNTRSVAELALGEIIMLLRRVFEKNAKLHRGVWDKNAAGSYEARGKTLGIVGYGKIGSQLGLLAEALGMKVCFYDLAEKLTLGNAKPCHSLEELLQSAKIISIHVDGRPENKNLIGEKEFALMRTGTIFLNLSRGSVADLEALAKNLQTEKIAGAAIDVYPEEPSGNEGKFINPLQNCPNTILTPHIGGSTEEAQKNIAEFVSAQMINFLGAGNTEMCVTLPNMQAAPPATNRIIHIHNNVPGVLAKITNVLATHNLNILGQQLKTNEKIGYAVLDIDKNLDAEILNQLINVPATINCRII